MLVPGAGIVFQSQTKKSTTPPCITNMLHMKEKTHPLEGDNGVIYLICGIR